MMTLSENTKGLFRKVVCMSLPPALTENTETEVVLQFDHSTLHLNVVYTTRTYYAFGMEHYVTTIKIDNTFSNLRKINMAGLEPIEFMNISEYKCEGSYKGSRQYHLTRYTNQIMDELFM